MPETGHLGVRRIMAKFENSGSSTPTSPPVRGRSPVNSDTSVAAPRPAAQAADDQAASEKESLQNDSSKEGRRESSGKVPSSSSVKEEKGSSSSPKRKEAERPSGKEWTKEKAPPRAHGSVHSSETNDKSTSNTKPRVVNGTASKPASAPAKTAAKRPSTVNTRQQASKSAASTISESGSAPSAKPSSTAGPSKSVVEKAGIHKLRGTIHTHHSPIPQIHTTKATTSPGAHSVPTEPAHSSAMPKTLSGWQSATGTANSKTSTTPATSANLDLSRKQPAATSRGKESHLRPSARTTNSTVRKQETHVSLADSSAGKERRTPRTSNVRTKPVSESFLARLTRPTASSAGKVHEKVEVKSPPRPTKTTGTAPRKTSTAKDQPSPRIPGWKEAREGSSHKEKPSSSIGGHAKPRISHSEPSAREKADQSHSKPVNPQHGKAGSTEATESAVEKVEGQGHLECRDGNQTKDTVKNLSSSSNGQAVEAVKGDVGPPKDLLTGAPIADPDAGKVGDSAKESTTKPPVQNVPEEPVKPSLHGHEGKAVEEDSDEAVNEQSQDKAVGSQDASADGPEAESMEPKQQAVISSAKAPSPATRALEDISAPTAKDSGNTTQEKDYTTSAVNEMVDFAINGVDINK